MERDPEIEALVRQKGAELEAALREAGSPLPPGLTGRDFVEWAMADGERRAKSPEGQAPFRRTKRVVEEVAAALPGGIDDPDFLPRLKARSQDLFGDSGAASA
jgi:hypothetical protein